jgi:hypothetical protein
MSLLIIGFVFIISSLVILYRDDNMFGDLNIVRFILLVLMFVVSIMYGWNGILSVFLFNPSGLFDPV